MRNPFKKAVPVLVAVTTALLGSNLSLGQGAAIADTDPTIIDIFTFNDFHGRIDEAITVPWAATLEQAALAADAAGHDVATISAGDNIGASLFASASDQDFPTLDVLNLLTEEEELGFAASAVGNHEFDQGFKDLTTRVDGAANFEYLGANVRYAKDGSEALTPYYIQTLASGLTLGIIGVVTVETPTLVSPAGVADLRFDDPVTTVNTYAAQLTDGNAANGEADIIVAVYHEGAAVGEPKTLADAVAATEVFNRIVNDTSPKVAAIINGHTHQKYAWSSDTPKRPIIQAGSYGDNVGHITLTWDGEKVTAFTVENIARITNLVPNANGNGETDIGAPCAAEAVPDKYKVGNIPAIYKSVCDSIAAAAVIGNVVIAKVSADITTAAPGGSWADGKYSVKDIAGVAGAGERVNESALANLAADSFLWTANKEGSQVTGGADIGIINAGGGIRANLLYGTNGDISYAAANAVMPFVNNVWTVELTGAQFKQFLEEQWQTDSAGARPGRPFLVTGLSSNVTYTVNSDNPEDDACAYDSEAGCEWNDAASHITGVFVNGEPLDAEKTYKIITLSFLTAGGDNYRVMAEGANATDTGLVDRDCWIDYLKYLSGNTTGTPTKAIAPSFAHRSVVVSNASAEWTPMEPIEATPGTTLTFSVSRLNMISQGSPAAATGTLTLTPVGGGAVTEISALTFIAPDGDCVADAGVSDTLNPASTGCAAITWEIPADLAAGDYVLTVAVKENGTEGNIWVRVPELVNAPTGGEPIGATLPALGALLLLGAAVLVGRRKLA
ncbi:MAG: 5'-nucleotidase C-terminal domain-containing protein [Propionibacteriaceae bacterium]|jgi:5'-nucleotidase|nr:5'-nucleotidase C-terminal domain-containing protein [Propionibacteriaceae bacterium]